MMEIVRNVAGDLAEDVKLVFDKKMFMKKLPFLHDLVVGSISTRQGRSMNPRIQRLGESHYASGSITDRSKGPSRIMSIPSNKQLKEFQLRNLVLKYGRGVGSSYTPFFSSSSISRNTYVVLFGFVLMTT